MLLMRNESFIADVRCTFLAFLHAFTPNFPLNSDLRGAARSSLLFFIVENVKFCPEDRNAKHLPPANAK